MSKLCWYCNNGVEEITSKTREGIIFKFFKCRNCGHEFWDKKHILDISKEYKLLILRKRKGI